MTEDEQLDRAIATMNWEMVDQLQPVDTSNIMDRGMKGVVMLAVALGWNLRQNKGQPAQLVSREGLTRNIPTNTGVRQSVFWSLIANVISHSDGKLPTSELIDLIVRGTGMSKAHAHDMKQRVTALALRAGVMEEEPELEPVPEDTQQPEPEPEPTTQVIESEDDPTIVRIEPTYAQATRGFVYESVLMDTVIRRLVPDGEEQITYRCKVCGLEFPTKRGVGGHYGFHVQAGEAKATADLPRKLIRPPEAAKEPEPDPIVEVEVEWEPEPVTMRIERVEPEPPVMVIARMIQQEIDLAVESATLDLTAENNRLRQRNDSLERSLATLHDLLGEIREKS